MPAGSHRDPAGMPLVSLGPAQHPLTRKVVSDVLPLAGGATTSVKFWPAVNARLPVTATVLVPAPVLNVTTCGPDGTLMKPPAVPNATPAPVPSADVPLIATRLPEPDAALKMRRPACPVDAVKLPLLIVANDV